MESGFSSNISGRVEFQVVELRDDDDYGDDEDDGVTGHWSINDVIFLNFLIGENVKNKKYSALLLT